VITKGRLCTLHNAKTDWSYFQELLTTFLNYSIPLKTENDIICAVESFNHEVQQAAWNATPVCKNTNTSFEYSFAINSQKKESSANCGKCNRCPVLKTKLNRTIKALRNLLETERNQVIQRYLSDLSQSAENNYSLWKATKRLKRPQTQFPPIRKQDRNWARSDEGKAEIFVAHLSLSLTLT